MLDPENWNDFRTQGHRMLDDMIDYLQHIRERPVWQPANEDVRQHFQTALPSNGAELHTLHHEFMQHILPYAVGNAHPGFMGWVHGGGTPVGMLAEMLAAGLNANLGGRNQIPLEVERQVIAWMRDLFGFPALASGVLTTGTSAATVIALVTARDSALNTIATTLPMSRASQQLVAYASQEAHGCIARAMRVIGLDHQALRCIPCNDQYQIDLVALRNQIAADKTGGYTPWLIVGTAGTVNTGAIDDLESLAAIADKAGAWLHVDGAFGALAMLSTDIAPRLHGIEQADSLALDFHKWAQVPYDAGMVLIRDGDKHRHSFATADVYLQREKDGLAANSPWPCDYGIDLSRGFRALKVWFTFKAYGSDKMGAVISHCCQLAKYLEQQISLIAQLELMSPVSLNIVCFRYCGDKNLSDEQYDTMNRSIIRHIQLSGLAAPSLSTLHERVVIRAAMINHRTSQQDIDHLLAATLDAAHACQAPLLEKSQPEKSQPEASKSEATYQQPTHLENNMASLQSVAATNHQLIGLAKLTTLAFKGEDLTPVVEQLSTRILHHPDDAGARMDLATIHFLLQKPQSALQWQQIAMDMQTHYTLSSNPIEPALRMLVLMGAGNLMDNLPVEFLLEGSAISMDLHFMQSGHAIPQNLNDYDLLLIAVGESDRNAALLQQLAAQLQDCPIAVINRPEHIIQTSREAAASLLQQETSLEMPMSVRLNRQQLKQLAASEPLKKTDQSIPHGDDKNDCETGIAQHLPGQDFPIIVRPVESHGGHGLVRLDQAADTMAYLSEQQEALFYVSRFVNYASPDGLFRKYRIVLIAGTPFLCHLAISSHWLVHYLNAGMIDNADKCAEEADCMANFDQTFARKHQQAFTAMYEHLQLEYLIIDCAECNDGRLLVFEVDTSAIVHAMDPVSLFPYKRPQMHKIFRAFQQMLMRLAKA